MGAIMHLSHVEGVNQALAGFSDIEVQLTEMKLNQAHLDSDRARQHYPYDSKIIPRWTTRAAWKKKMPYVLAAKAVKEGEADAVLSAGNMVLCYGWILHRVSYQEYRSSWTYVNLKPTVDGRGFWHARPRC